MEKFNERLSDVFGALDSLQPSKLKQKPSDSKVLKEKSKDSSREVYTPPAKRARDSGASPSHDRIKYSDRRFKGRQHSYQKRTQPDYVQNPNKWRKYDLKDDGTKGLKGMSADEVNRHAAFGFLDELKKRKTRDKEEDGAIVDEIQEREEEGLKTITFKKPRPKHPTPSGVGRGLTPVHGCHGNSVVTMEEYVVGRDKSRQRRGVKRTVLGGERERTSTAPSKRAAAITLSHLDDEDEEDTV